MAPTVRAVGDAFRRQPAAPVPLLESRRRNPSQEKPLSRLVQKIRGAISPPNTASGVAAALVSARQDLADAEAAVAGAAEAYRGALSEDLEDAALLRHKEAETLASIRRDRALARVTKLETDHVAATEAEATAARLAAYEAARAKRDEVAALLTKTYPGLVDRLRELVRSSAESDMAVAAANADQPSGSPKLATAEEIARVIPGEPYEVVRVKEISLWCAAGSTTPLPDHAQALVQRDANVTGPVVGRISVEQTLEQRINKTPAATHFYDLRRFRLTKYRPATMALHPGFLAQSAVLPPFRPGDRAWAGVAFYADADSILRLLDEPPELLVQQGRSIETKLEPLPDLVEADPAAVTAAAAE